MIERDELVKRLRQRPFEPFRLHLTDGRYVDVLYPDMNLVLSTYAMIGIPEANHPDPVADRFELIELSLVQGIEALLKLAPPSTWYAAGGWLEHAI